VSVVLFKYRKEQQRRQFNLWQHRVLDSLSDCPKAVHVVTRTITVLMKPYTVERLRITTGIKLAIKNIQVSMIPGRTYHFACLLITCTS
jgi:hypothetical protein